MVKKLKVGFVNFAPLHYDVLTPFNRPLGGSESNMCFSCIELAKRGHDIILYGLYDKMFRLKNVTHKDKSFLENIEKEKLDCLVIQNTIYNTPLFKNTAGRNFKIILWQQLHTDQPPTFALENVDVRASIDKYVFVSNWQMEKFLARYPLEEKKCFVIKNAVSPAFENLFPNKSILKYKKPILAYTSAPFRGLETLLVYLFPEIKKCFPEVKLKVFSSMKTYQKNDAENAVYKHLYDICRTTDGVIYRGSVSQKQLARELKPVIALTYPNTFYETSSIAVMEAMAAGCKVITTASGALPETTAGFAHLIPVNDNYSENREMFIKHTIETLNKLKSQDKSLEEELSKQVKFCNKNYIWKKRAIEWEKLLSSLSRFC